MGWYMSRANRESSLRVIADLGDKYLMVCKMETNLGGTGERLLIALPVIVNVFS